MDPAALLILFSRLMNAQLQFEEALRQKTEECEGLKKELAELRGDEAKAAKEVAESNGEKVAKNVVMEPKEPKKK